MSWKSVLKRAALTPPSVVGLFGAARALAGRRDAIVCYHRVVDSGWERFQSGTAVSAATFRRHLNWLRARFEVVDIAELAKTHLTGERPHRPRVVITFDDGWRDNYTCAFPILRELGLTATIFLATDMIDGRRVYWNARVERAMARIHDRLDDILTAFPDEKLPPEGAFLPALLAARRSPARRLHAVAERVKMLDEAGMERVIAFLEELAGPASPVERDVMNWDEVREMLDAGIAFGAHSASHRLLDALSADECRRELMDSRDIVAERTGVAPLAFAYPNGNRDESVMRETRRAGFLCAVTTRQAFVRPDDDLFDLPRFVMHEGAAPDDAALDALMSGLRR